MIEDTTGQERADPPLRSSFDRYLSGQGSRRRGRELPPELCPRTRPVRGVGRRRARRRRLDRDCSRGGRPRSDVRRPQRASLPRVRSASFWRSRTQTEHGPDLLRIHLGVVWLVCQRGVFRSTLRSASERDRAAPRRRRPEAW